MLKYLQKRQSVKLWCIFMVGYNCHWKCSQRRCNYMDICSNQMLRGAKYAIELSAQCDFNFLYAHTEGWKGIILKYQWQLYRECMVDYFIFF